MEPTMMPPLNPVKQATCARNTARRRGLAANLSAEEWLHTINDCGGACVYCGKPYQTIDHFIPMAHSGGSTIDNCVPSCLLCNRNKASPHPREIRSIPRDIILHIKRYLERRDRLYTEQQQARWRADRPAHRQELVRWKRGQEMTTEETRCRLMNVLLDPF